MSSAATIDAGGRAVEVSSPDKELFPADGITKRGLAEYYVRAADSMLPHLRGRPIQMVRHPDGIDAGGFVQKQAGEHFPDWIETVRIPKREGGSNRQVVVSDAATLAFLADQAAIEIHPWLSGADDLDHPDQLIFDLDPTGEDFDQVRRAARAVRDLLDEVGLPAFCKTTGSRGVHVVVPLERGPGFDEVRDFASDAARATACRHPDELTTETRKEDRRGRLFVDWLRNSYAQTAVAPYSVRARPGAPVATPIDWEELGRVESGTHATASIFRRLAAKEDPWRHVPQHASSLGRARERLDELLAELGLA